MCVPVSYADDTFCERHDYCKSSMCENLVLDGDHCYEDHCVDGALTNTKRENATIFENKTNACVDFICDNDIGPVVTTVCNSFEGERHMCINGGCLPISGMNVEIEV